DGPEPAVDFVDIDQGRASEDRLVGRAEQLGDGRKVVACRGPGIHAGTRESRESARPPRVWTSRSGWGSGVSPRRLIQTVRSPSDDAGAMSWTKLAATWTCAARSAPVREKNSSQC